MRRPVTTTSPFLLAAPPPPASNYKPVALAGYLVIAFCFGGLGLWAALAKLGSSVQAGGTVSVATNRKVVEHLEGGLVTTINVKEGQEVKTGDLLVQFSDVQTMANLDIAQDDLYQLMAQESRLMAERDHRPSITWAQELLSKSESKEEIKKSIDDQATLFSNRRQSLDSQMSILDSRSTGLRDELEGLKREGGSAQQQLQFIDDELAGVSLLFDRGLVPRTRRNALEREKARIDGIVGRNEADTAKVQNSILELKLQTNQLKQRFSEEVANSFGETRQKMADLTTKINVYVDAEKRNSVVAPVSGVVQNLKVSTIGQVLHAGEPLLEIVPNGDALVVQVHVPPADIADIHEDMQAEIKFTSFHSRTTPLVLGKVSSMSRDALVDEATHASYFLARIAIADTDIPEDLKGHLRAGMQAEVIFPTGERTVLQYLVHPLVEAFSKTFREK